MEKTYKTALEIILMFCKKDTYTHIEDIQLICETVLKESGDEDACTR